MLATQCSALCCPLETNFWWFQNERHSSTQKMLSLDFLKGFECWLIMFWLNELLQVTIRSLVASNSVTFFSTDERSSFFIPPQKTQQLSSTFEFYWVLTDHVSFGWGDAGWNQVICCKQFGDIFLDRWEVFVLHPSTKSPDSCQALFEFYWWMTEHVSFEWAFTSYNQVLSCKQWPLLQLWNHPNGHCVVCRHPRYAQPHHGLKMSLGNQFSKGRALALQQ